MGNAVGAAVFFLVAPGTIAGLLPFLITRWRMAEPLLGLEITRWPGPILLAAGLVVIVDAFVRFVREGRGTPAPVAPPRLLVVRGPYRWVRNPIYLAIESVIVGQALVFASSGLLVYGALVALAFHAAVVVYEEPTLRRQFGADYEAYVAAVPRWMPRPPRPPV